MRIIIISFLISLLSACASGSDQFATSMTGEYQLPTYDIDNLNNNEFKVKAAFIYSLLANTSELRTHQFNGASKNEVYVYTRDDIESGGYPELVVRFDFDANGEKIDGTGTTIMDCENKGSFNYKHPEKEPLGHFAQDILPWIQLGNCREDKTTREERIAAYVQDIELGLEKLEASNSGYFLPTNFSMTGSGQSETIAFFIKSLEQESFNLYSFIMDEKISFDKKNEFYQVLELGINRNFE